VSLAREPRPSSSTKAAEEGDQHAFVPPQRGSGACSRRYRLVHGGASAQTDARSYGTWKLNVAKSKFSPGPAPKSLTVKWEAAGQGVRLTSEGVTADGKPMSGGYTANYDGKDYPMVGCRF
jgi:hypothetical protein